MLLELLRLTPEQIAKGETWSPTDGERTRDGGDKIGDKVMSILTGTDYASEVEKHAKENYRTKMTRRFGDDIKDVEGVAGYKPIGDLTKLEPDQIQREIDRRTGTRNARSSYRALTGEDFEDTTVTDPGTIKSSATRALNDQQRVERERQEGRADNLLMMQMLQNNRQSDRQFQLQMAQNEYNNRRLDMQDARAERRDRQAMIMQLMKGLAQMGQGIAI